MRKLITLILYTVNGGAISKKPGSLNLEGPDLCSSNDIEKTIQNTLEAPFLVITRDSYEVCLWAWG